MTHPRPAAGTAAPPPTPAAARPGSRPRLGPRPRPAADDSTPREARALLPPGQQSTSSRGGLVPVDRGQAATPVDVPVVPAGQVDVWELVRRAQAGDPEGFGRLYDRYVGVVFRYLLPRVADRATAEDLTSETFVRALRRIDTLSAQGRDVGAWLVTIARNLVLDHLKSGRYRLEVSTADMREVDQATDGPEEAVLRRLASAEVLAGVQQLSADQRECLVLRFLHQLSVAETAAVMGRKDGAVKALQHRAVRRLAALLPDGLR